MLRLDARHELPAVALFVVFTAAPFALFAQAPVATPAPGPSAQSSLLSPPSVSAPHPALVEPTPEQLADSLAAHQHYQAAIEAYAKIPAKSASLWNKMGVAYQMMFNMKDATRCYKESFRLSAHDPLVLNNLGTVYDSQRRYKAAERIYHRALKIDPRSAAILENLGTNLLAQHKNNEGWDAYKKALAADPKIFQNHSGPKVGNPGSLEERGAMNYYMARACSLAKLTDCALQHLEVALDEGFITPKKVATDVDFASLRDEPAFQQLLAQQRKP
jgi:tetratricopeptide (TPR) repeat protein